MDRPSSASTREGLRHDVQPIALLRPPCRASGSHVSVR
ncbi:hypothetical protein OH687_29435 [Burkholderia anthina]|nr:hypothetical protein OH687_29435 [Burkholderia anthina]